MVRIWHVVCDHTDEHPPVGRVLVGGTQRRRRLLCVHVLPKVICCVFALFALRVCAGLGSQLDGYALAAPAAFGVICICESQAGILLLGGSKAGVISATDVQNLSGRVIFVLFSCGKFTRGCL
jgi:hypothetical protein